jgi:hypothetical protein
MPFSPVKENNTGFFFDLTLVEYDQFGSPTNRVFANLQSDLIDKLLADVEKRIIEANPAYSSVLASLLEEKDNYLALKKDFETACKKHIFTYATQAEYNKFFASQG